MGGSPSAPTPQDPNQVAQTQQGYNTQAGLQSQSGSMVGQNNQYGSLSYTRDPNSPSGYTSNINLSPTQQGLFNTFTGSQGIAGQEGQALWGNSAGLYGSNPISTIGNMGQGLAGSQMQGFYSLMSPYFTNQTQELDAQLRNQGNNPSPSANPHDPSTWGPYERAMYQNQTTQSQQVAGAAANYLPSAMNTAMQEYGLPASLAQSLSGFGMAQSPTGSLVQTPGLNINPADYTTAVQNYQQMQEQNYQAEMARQSALMSGIFGAAGKIGGAMIMSDRRLKTDIQQIGNLENGLPVYTFKFLWSPQRVIGLMADDVKQLYPEAVGQIGGFDAVDYNLAVR